MSRKEALEYCNHNIEIANYFQKHSNAGYTFVKGMMISYGKIKVLLIDMYGVIIKESKGRLFKELFNFG